jgi:hypothetical protein
MASSYTLIEEQFDTNYYVKVQSDFDSQLLFGSMNSLLMVESLTAGSPMMVMRFLDNLGVLVNSTYISPDASYDVFFGKDKLSTKKGSFSLSTNDGKSLGAGNIENVAMDINFLSNNWFNVLYKSASRSWSSVYYSDVVQQIAEECGFTNIDVEKTDEKVDVIQPNWSNYQMIKWLAKHAKSAEGITGYEILAKLDGSFSFKTYNTLFKQAPLKNLYLSTTQVGDNMLYGLNTVQQYAPLIKNGAAGQHYVYFDYDNKQFVTGNKTLSSTKQAQLSDWFFVSQDHDIAYKNFFGGRDIKTEDVVESKIAGMANSIQEIRTTIMGDVKLHIGDIVNVVLAPSKKSTKPINEMYSGYWMISQVTQIVDFGAKQVRTDLRLMRAGLNGRSLKNLVKSSTGKQIAKNPNPVG